MLDPDGRLVLCGDVVALNLVTPRPDPPHVEDWITDFVRARPRRLRRLTGEKRAAFFPRYLDQAPQEVFIEHKRSLCLVEPEQVWATFTLDRYSGKYQVRLRFTLPGEVQCPRAMDRRGLPVTDLKWRALGRDWLAQARRGRLNLSHEALMERLGAEALYLTLGLSRRWRGEYWPLVHAIHVVPDYEATIDLENL